MKHSIFLFLLVVIVKCDDFENFYNYVENRLDQINKHVRPTDNSYMYSTKDSTIYNGGSYDFVIVGGGSAGTVLASRLSEIKHWSVLLLEAGGSKDNFSDIPGFSSSVQASDMDWGYITTPQKTCCLGMENNQCVYPRGRVIGGSSTINALIYTRGNKNDFDEWEKLGNPGWSYEDVLPYFMKSEVNDMKKCDKEYHGFDGPLHVNYTGPPDVITEYFKKALNEVGIEELDVNGKQQIGMHKVPLTIDFNKRCSGYDAFVAPIEKQRKNLKIILNAFVIKLLLNKNEAIGVIYNKNGKTYKAFVKKELILSAGSVNTPQLLILSGLGPEESLKQLGIDVKHNLPGVGNNLQDHPHYFLNIRTNITRDITTLKEDLKEYLQGKTPLTRGLGGEIIAFVNISTESLSDIEILSLIPSANVLMKNLYNFENNDIDVNLSTDFVVVFVLLKPKSRGEIILRSKSPLEFPLIDVRYFSDPDNIDLDTMYKGVKFIRKLSQTEALKQISATIINQQPGCEDLLTDDCKQSNYQNDCDKSYWYCALRKYASTLYHATGTASMGPNPKHHVVDHNCLVHNYRNFRIVDASVMPKILHGHPNAAVYMIAEKIADEIKKHHKQ